MSIGVRENDLYFRRMDRATSLAPSAQRQWSFSNAKLSVEIEGEGSISEMRQ